MSALYIQIIPRASNTPSLPPPEDWTPWRNAAPGEEEMTVRLAIHRWVRNSGGITQPTTLDVFHQREGQKPRSTQHAVFNLYPK